ncbi:hypothetical protein ABI59_13270 [Acidobacteria bacterium Mor1]|nr:hypothetical protein ABI59_13270 [Acidobacteria bacterium Mor1]
MLHVLTVVIVVIGAVFLLLTGVIVVNKAWRETRQRRFRSRRTVLEPQILRWVHHGEGSLSQALSGETAADDGAVIESVLLDLAQRVRGEELERISASLDEMGYVDDYLERLGSRSWWVRARAAEQLGLAMSRRSVDSLVRALEDESSEVRIRAAQSLAQLGGEASLRPLILALNEPSRWSTIRIADILTSMGRQVVDQLIDLWPDLTRRGRLAALDVIGRIRPLRAQPWLYDRLADEDADIRARACHALGAIGDPNSGDRVADLLQDPEWPVRAMAAKALGRMRYDTAIPALCESLRDAAWWTRSNAAEALRSMGRKGVTALDRMLDDEDRYARHQAVLMLQQVGIVDEQVDRLAHAGPEAAAAEEMLRRMAHAGPADRLAELLERHPDSRVRQILAGILDTPGSEVSS